MSRSHRVPLALPLLLVFVAACFVLLVPRAGHWLRHLPAGLGELGQEWVRGRELRAESQATHARLEVRHEVARAVAEGRLSLLEGAARFRALDREEPPVILAQLRTTYPGATAEVRSCRHLIRWVRLWLNDHPGADRRVVQRLEAELGEHLCGGTLRLPEPEARPSVLPRSS
jgi:hypothetical protein